VNIGGTCTLRIATQLQMFTMFIVYPGMHSTPCSFACRLHSLPVL